LAFSFAEGDTACDVRGVVAFETIAAAGCPVAIFMLFIMRFVSENCGAEPDL
jgi:hypothetical protein